MVVQNYFDVFSLPSRFPVDLAALERTYFAAQRQSHPDRLVGKAPAEREQAIRRSMLINEAYETLKSPLKRARHLLALAGIAPDCIKASPSLLMDIMELREALTEAQDKNTLEKIGLQNAEAREETSAQMAKAFSEPDLPRAAELCMRLSYLLKIEEEIRSMDKRLDV